MSFKGKIRRKVRPEWHSGVRSDPVPPPGMERLLYRADFNPVVEKTHELFHNHPDVSHEAVSKILLPLIVIKGFSLVIPTPSLGTALSFVLRDS